MADVELAAVASGVAQVGQCVFSGVDSANFKTYATMVIRDEVQALTAVKLRVQHQMIYKYSANYSPWYGVFAINATTGAETQVVGWTYCSGSVAWTDHTLNLTGYRAIYLMIGAMIPGGYNSWIGAYRSAHMVLTGDSQVIKVATNFDRIRSCAAGSAGVAEVRALTYPGELLFPGPIVRAEPVDRALLQVDGPWPVGDVELMTADLMTRARPMELHEVDLTTSVRTVRLHATVDGSPDLDG